MKTSTLFAAEAEINPTQFVASRPVQLRRSSGRKMQESANVAMNTEQTLFALTRRVQPTTRHLSAQSPLVAGGRLSDLCLLPLLCVWRRRVCPAASPLDLRCTSRRGTQSNFLAGACEFFLFFFFFFNLSLTRSVNSFLRVGPPAAPLRSAPCQHSGDNVCLCTQAVNSLDGGSAP